MKAKLLVALVVGFLSIQISFSQNVTSLSLSKDTANICDSVTLTISGTHPCANTVILGYTLSTSGSNITVTLNISSGICLPITTPYTTTYILPLSPYTVGSKTVWAKYTASGNSISKPLFIQGNGVAHAGSDTTFCDVSGYQLNGSALPTGATGTWTVQTGSGIFTNASLPNTMVTNMGNGQNKYKWTVVDPLCTTADIVKITQYDKPSTATAEADKFSCYDTDSISATAPSAGLGAWKNVTTGISIFPSTSANAKVSFLKLGMNKMTWTVSNGICTESVDTLIVEHETVVDTPTITSSGSILTSTTAPGYQWYRDQVAIAGAINQTYKATVNGVHKVMAVYPGCDNGIFSNEIDVTTVGLDAINKTDALKIYPNPSSGIIEVEGINENALIELFNITGENVLSVKTQSSNTQLDLSNLKRGVYYLTIHSEGDIHSERIVLMN